MVSRDEKDSVRDFTVLIAAIARNFEGKHVKEIIVNLTAVGWDASDVMRNKYNLANSISIVNARPEGLLQE